MFDIGFSELVLIFVIGLVVLGPERLPKAARTLGLWIGRAKSTFNNLRNELEREAFNQEMRDRMDEQMREMGLDEDSIRQARDSLLSPEDAARVHRRDEEREQHAHNEGSEAGRLIDQDETTPIDHPQTEEHGAEPPDNDEKGPEKHPDV